MSVRERQRYAFGVSPRDYLLFEPAAKHEMGVRAMHMTLPPWHKVLRVFLSSTLYMWRRAHVRKGTLETVRIHMGTRYSYFSWRRHM